MIDVVLNRQSNTTVAKQMYLYDYGQEMHIIGKLPENCQVHFSFTKNYTDRSNIRNVTKTEDGGIVEIPNQIFQATTLLSNKKYVFYAYLFNIEDDDSAHTFHVISVTVIERPMPDDYVPDPDVPYINERIAILEEEVELLREQITALSALVTDNIVYYEGEDDNP